VAGVSGVNVVVQQSGSAKEAHPTRNQSSEHQQSVTAQQQVHRDTDGRTTVRASVEADRFRDQEQDSKKKKKRLGLARPDTKNRSESENSDESDSGQLLNTIA